jgi:hypothetical protein
MYRTINLPRKVLISTDEVIAQAPVVAVPEINNILAAIQIAEERFIKPAICKELYYDFRNEKNVVVTDDNKEALEAIMNEKSTGTVLLEVGDIVNAIELVSKPQYKDLWNEYLWKITAECVMYIASPTNYSRYTAQGEMENNPKTIGSGEGAATVDLGTMKWKMDKLLQDRINPLLTAMHEWLFDNRNIFPLYNCREYKQDKDQVSVKGKTAWVNVYDNHRKRRCCDD